ncbi:MAG: hypothetical protein WA984_19225 [Phormidesmis sp.]
MLTNTELIETFIENSLREKEVLLANPTFKAETICGVNQLMSHKDGPLIKVDIRSQAKQFYLRQNSPHTLLLKKLLYRHQFLIAENAQAEDAQSDTNTAFDIYQYFSIQRDYQFNYDTGRALWKNWRAIKRLSKSTSKLLVRQGTTWTSIRAISVSNELMFIETADNTEVVHSLKDSVLWLDKVAQKTTQKNVASSKAAKSR